MPDQLVFVSVDEARQPEHADFARFTRIAYRDSAARTIQYFWRARHSEYAASNKYIPSHPSKLFRISANRIAAMKLANAVLENRWLDIDWDSPDTPRRILAALYHGYFTQEGDKKIQDELELPQPLAISRAAMALRIYNGYQAHPETEMLVRPYLNEIGRLTRDISWCLCRDVSALTAKLTALPRTDRQMVLLPMSQERVVVVAMAVLENPKMERLRDRMLAALPDLFSDEFKTALRAARNSCRGSGFFTQEYRDALQAELNGLSNTIGLENSAQAKDVFPSHSFYGRVVLSSPGLFGDPIIDAASGVMYDVIHSRAFVNLYIQYVGLEPVFQEPGIGPVEIVDLHEQAKAEIPTRPAEYAYPGVCYTKEADNGRPNKDDLTGHDDGHVEIATYQDWMRPIQLHIAELLRKEIDKHNKVALFADDLNAPNPCPADSSAYELAVSFKRAISRLFERATGGTKPYFSGWADTEEMQVIFRNMEQEPDKWSPLNREAIEMIVSTESCAKRARKF